MKSFTVLFLTVYMRKFLYDRDIKALPLRILYVLAAFLVGAYSENCSSTVVFCSACFLLLGRFVKKQKIAPYLWLALLGQGCPHCRRFPTAASRRSLGRVSVPVWPITLSGRLCIVA